MRVEAVVVLHPLELPALVALVAGELPLLLVTMVLLVQPIPEAVAAVRKTPNQVAMVVQEL
jgi:hypothetical protein